MTGDTILFRKGSSFSFQGQLKDPAGVGLSLAGITLGIYETEGAGMQELEISKVDEPTGKFRVDLTAIEAKKLPMGRSSWFKIQFAYDGTPAVIVFPPIWLDTR